MVLFVVDVFDGRSADSALELNLRTYKTVVLQRDVRCGCGPLRGPDANGNPNGRNLLTAGYSTSKMCFLSNLILFLIEC